MNRLFFPLTFPKRSHLLWLAWRKRISAVFVMTVSPADAMAREKGLLPVEGGKGSIMNHEVLNQMLNTKPLNPRLDLCNHSPTGFECGYSGSGPAQLALALLAEHLNNDEQAVALHQPFKRKVVAALSPREWRLTSKQVER